jgi:hypothetical protein
LDFGGADADWVPVAKSGDGVVGNSVSRRDVKIYQRLFKVIATILAGAVLWGGASALWGHVAFSYAVDAAKRQDALSAIQWNLRAYRRHPWDYQIRQQLILFLAMLVVKERKRVRMTGQAWKNACRISNSASPHHPLIKQMCNPERKK